MKTPLATALLVATLLSGCSDGGGGGGETPPPGTTAPLPPDKGAITGILIDDAFRPLHLTETPTGDYDFKGILLLQPVGLTSRTTPDGTFGFSGLEPGSYTLRADVEGHESAPVVLDVRAGEYTEVDLVARRVLNAGSRIVTTEYSVFVPCSASVPAGSINPPCLADLSGDTDRFAFYANYTAFSNVTYLVTEMKANREASPESGALKVVVRTETGDDPYWASAFTVDGDYIRIVMKMGEKSEQDTEDRNEAWNNTRAMQVALFPQGAFKAESQQAIDAACAADPVGAACFESRGLGVQAGVRAKFVQSLFIGEPDVDIATYAVLE